MALEAALATPPFGADAATKERHMLTVMDCLSAFKAAEVASTVPALAPPVVDVLMKYVYRGMEDAEGRWSAQLLTWHAEAVKVAGLGCVSRVLTDRATV